jgi:hypothetical protein
MNDVIDRAERQVAESLGLTKKLVHDVYAAYWKTVREHIVNLPLKEDLTDEEFLQLQPNVNIPSIGKFYVTLDRYKRLKNSYNERNTK